MAQDLFLNPKGIPKMHMKDEKRALDAKYKQDTSYFYLLHFQK